MPSFSLTMFSFVYELKGYWAYKYAIRNINFFLGCRGKSYSRFEIILWQPLVATTCCLLSCYLVVTGFLLFFFNHCSHVLYCYFFVPMIIYIMCWMARNCYVKQLQQATIYTLKYRNLHHYTCLNVTVTVLTSFAVISPLIADDDFFP